MSILRVAQTVAAARGHDPAHVADVAHRALGEIESIALREGRCLVAGFGLFKLRRRAKRVARNPRTGAPVEVPARTALVFRHDPSWSAPGEPARRGTRAAGPDSTVGAICRTLAQHYDKDAGEMLAIVNDVLREIRRQTLARGRCDVGLLGVLKSRTSPVVAPRGSRQGALASQGTKLKVVLAHHRRRRLEIASLPLRTATARGAAESGK
jgi:nucleoid DNA-binding protein